MRQRITECVAAHRDTLGPQQRFLANVIGEPSPAVLELLSRPGRRAAVLMPIVERPGGFSMLFTARAEHLAHHPGQVAFPGGRIEPADATAADTALREAREEIGLPPEQVAIIGHLGAHMTGTGFIVTPFVGFVDPGFEPRPDPAEVAAVFEVPLEFLLDPANCRHRERERHGTRFGSFEFDWDGWHIWGATAGMVVTLSRILNI